jgi:hypothetical protein
MEFVFYVFTAVTMKDVVFWDVTPRAARRNIPEDGIPHVFCLYLIITPREH